MFGCLYIFCFSTSSLCVYIEICTDGRAVLQLRAITSSVTADLSTAQKLTPLAVPPLVTSRRGTVTKLRQLESTCVVGMDMNEANIRNSQQASFASMHIRND